MPLCVTCHSLLSYVFPFCLQILKEICKVLVYLVISVFICRGGSRSDRTRRLTPAAGRAAEGRGGNFLKTSMRHFLRLEVRREMSTLWAQVSVRAASL